MCTAITFSTDDHYFGRTLDVECDYNETITVTPRHFPLPFRTEKVQEDHYALIGMATVMDGYPLYYEAANEHGLAMAGLNFPGNAHYFPPMEGKDNISPFELIPWVLCQCRTLAEARVLLSRIHICAIPFSEALPLTPLHWILADGEGAITVESVAEGLRIYDNPVGVLTNNPPFDYHMTHLCDYMQLTPSPPENHVTEGLTPYSKGMGAMGLPGDFSSASRFVRAAFVKRHSLVEKGEESSVSQFFHILDTVTQPRGCVRGDDGRCMITVYTSCINTDKGIYYYTTYDNGSISAVDMHRCDLDGTRLCMYPLLKGQRITRQN